MKGDTAVTPEPYPRGAGDLARQQTPPLAAWGSMVSRRGRLLHATAMLFALASLGLASAADIGSLQKAGLHAIGFRQGSSLFVVQATGAWGGYQDNRPRGVPFGADKLLQVVAPGGAAKDLWSLASPYGDNWSARWTTTLKVPSEADYTFYVSSDDGARMWIDGTRIIDAWIPRSGDTSEAKVHLAAGDHPVRCEYFEQAGGAQAHVEWSGPGFSRQVIPPAVTSAEGKPGWKAEYFLNMELKGEPAGTHEDRIDMNWGDGGPSVFGGGPPGIALEWAHATDDLVLGRVKAPDKAYAGLIVHALPSPSMGFWLVGGELQALDRQVVGGSATRFRLRVLNANAAYGLSNPGDPPSVWVPGAEPLVFMAGTGPLPKLDATTVTARLERALAKTQ